MLTKFILLHVFNLSLPVQKKKTSRITVPKMSLRAPNAESIVCRLLLLLHFNHIIWESCFLSIDWQSIVNVIYWSYCIVLFLISTCSNALSKTATDPWELARVRFSDISHIFFIVYIIRQYLAGCGQRFTEDLQTNNRQGF